MSEKKEKKGKMEKKKKKVPIALYANSQILKSLSSAVEAQRVMSQSSMTAIAKMVSSSGLQQAFKAITEVSSFHKMIVNAATKQASVIQALQASPTMKAMAEYQKVAKRLADTYSEIHRMTNMGLRTAIEKPLIPKIAARISEIPPQTTNTVQSLLNYIGILEKELAREKAENKEIRRILADRKKEMEKYVA